MEFWLHFPTLDETFDLAEVSSEWTRIGCYFAVATLPDAALADALHELKGLMDFHAVPVAALPDPPTAPQRLTGKLGHVRAADPVRFRE